MTGEICDCLIYFRIIAKKTTSTETVRCWIFWYNENEIEPIFQEYFTAAWELQHKLHFHELWEHFGANVRIIFAWTVATTWCLENVQFSLAHSVFITVVLATDSLPLMCNLFAVVSFLVSGNNEADTQSLASDFVKVNSDQKCSDGEATCRSSVGRLLSKETRTAQNQHQTFLVITI